MIVYTVVHAHDFGQGAAYACNIKHFITKQDAFENMRSRFEKCSEGFRERGERFDSDINEWHAYISHFDGDVNDGSYHQPVYDHDWRIIAEQL